MKNAFWIFTLLFVLAACGKQEPAEPAGPTPAAEQQTVEDAADPVAEEWEWQQRVRKHRRDFSTSPKNASELSTTPGSRSS